VTRPAPPADRGGVEYGHIALVDLLDRLLGTGVVIAGDLTLSIADVDLVHVSLRALVSSVRAAARQQPPPVPQGTEW
jgi:Gas vesicle protein